MCSVVRYFSNVSERSTGPSNCLVEVWTWPNRGKAVNDSTTGENKCLMKWANYSWPAAAGNTNDPCVVVGPRISLHVPSNGSCVSSDLNCQCQVCFLKTFSSSVLCCSQRYETLLKDMEKKNEHQREALTNLQQELQKAQGGGKFWWSDPNTHLDSRSRWNNVNQLHASVLL